MAKNISGGLQTPFTGATKSSIGPAGDDVAVTNGFDLAGGEKGTPGVMPEVTTVTVNGIGEMQTVTVVGIANNS